MLASSHGPLPVLSSYMQLDENLYMIFCHLVPVISIAVSSFTQTNNLPGVLEGISRM